MRLRRTRKRENGKAKTGNRGGKEARKQNLNRNLDRCHE
jgi:hypothetical protein